MKTDNFTIETRYGDVIKMWQEAFEAGGGQFRLASANKAIQIMFKMHKARQLLRDRDAESPFDLFILRRQDNILTVQTRPLVEYEFTPAHAREALQAPPLDLEEEG